MRKPKKSSSSGTTSSTTPTDSNESPTHLNEALDRSTTNTFNSENLNFISSISTFNPLYSTNQQQHLPAKNCTKEVKEEIKSEKEDEEFKRSAEDASLVANNDYNSINTNGYSTGFPSTPDINWLNNHGNSNTSTSNRLIFT